MDKLRKGWEQHLLGELFEFKNGLNTDKSKYGAGCKFVNVMDVFNNDYLTEDKIIGSVQITEKQLFEYKLKYGDVLFNRTSEVPEEIAYSTVYLDDKDAVFGGFVIRARVITDKLNEKFLIYLFQSNKFRTQIIKCGQGAIRANIGQKDLAKIKIEIPPLPEQIKIAEILSTWDNAIQTTEKQIANSQQQKKALMQMLLSGEKRVGGFSGEWKKTKLADVFSKISNGLTYDTNLKSGLPVTRIETISTGKINLCKVGYAPDDENTKRFKLEKGDILYSHINSLEHIGKVAYYNSDEELYHGMNLLLLRVKSEFNSSFLYHMLNSEIGKKYAKSAINQASISTSDIKLFSLYMPSFEEQQKIAEILTTADQEIDTLQKKLECLKLEKRALMQKLL